MRLRKNNSLKANSRSIFLLTSKINYSILKMQTKRRKNESKEK